MSHPIDDLAQSIEAQHGGTARLAQSVPGRENFNGAPVWEGVVHVFDLESHPTAAGDYAWSSPIEGWTSAASLPCCDGRDKSPLDAAGGDRGGA